MRPNNLCTQEILIESKYMVLIGAPGSDYPCIVTIKYTSDFNKKSEVGIMRDLLQILIRLYH